MSIYSKALQEWRGGLAALLLTGALATLTCTSAHAAPAAPVQGVVTGGVIQIGGGVKVVQLNGHVPGLVRGATALGVDRSQEPLDLGITLPLRNKAALDNLIQGLSDPSDARHGQYLTPQQFTAQFGPTQAQYDAVVAWAQSKGFTVTQTWPDRTKVDVSGSVAQANAAFGVTLKQFRAASGQSFFAPDTEVRIPATMSGLISGVVGLDNSIIATPKLKLIGRAADPTADPTPQGTAPEQGTGLGGGFTPADLKTVYGLNGTSLNGAGQTIAMIEYGSGFNQKDARKYETAFGLPNVPIQAIQVGTAFTTYTGASTETMLDIDMQIALAPGAAKILVYQGRGNTNNSLSNTIKQAQTDNIAKQVSISYGFGRETTTTPSTFQQTLNTIFTTMVAQGQSVYISSGDSGSDGDGVGTANTDQLGSQPMICCVGGTQLTVQNPGVNENYLAETTWNIDGTASSGGGGGGISISWPIPGYQTNAANLAAVGTNVSKTQRNIPDISAVASPYTGVLIYSSVDPSLSPGWYIFGGTSASAPIWAGYTALINQNLALNGKSVMGFPNAVLYPLAYTANGTTSTYASLFHDIRDGSSNHTDPGSVVYTALTGFDDSTGLGSFQGLNLLSAISGPYPTR